MLKPYQDIQDWSRDQLEEEIENLHKDQQAGEMNRETYRRCYEIVLGEILRKEDIDTQQRDYERSMRGI